MNDDTKKDPTTTAPPAPVSINAPHGIAIGGGNVTNPTVNNFSGIAPALITVTARAQNVPGEFKIKSRRPFGAANEPQALLRSEFAISIQTQVPIPTLTIRVSAPSLAGLNLNQAQGGAYAGQFEDERDVTAAVSVQHAIGDYVLVVFSRAVEDKPSIELVCPDGFPCVLKP